MGEIAITVEDLHISYQCVNAISLKKTLFRKKDDRSRYFEAVKGISFELEKGKILGVIGKNGSGKSTMLRALAGIFSPDQGKIDLHGHSISLLAIGVGFNKELSGRENVILSGLLLGFTEQEVQEHMDAIIEFADLGDFIDRPVRTYSSGMYSKLAFSITANLQTDIILVDEVLSVGDSKFKKKSFKKMKELISDKDRTVIIVSHSARSLKELCDNVLWMHEGKIMMLGSTQETLEKYEEFMA